MRDTEACDRFRNGQFSRRMNRAPTNRDDHTFEFLLGYDLGQLFFGADLYDYQQNELYGNEDRE